MIDNKKIIEMLGFEKIAYKLYNHPPLFTVDDSKNLRGDIAGAHTKNLFFKNKKDNFFLFSCLESTKIDLKILNKKLSLGNISFANEKYLQEMLNVKPGAVNPYGLLNSKNLVKFFFDKKLFSQELVNFHPMDNRQTISLKTLDFIRFIKKNNILVNILDFDNYTITNE